VQADSIIPDPYSPLSYDRYAYVRNSPVNFNDPSGHQTNYTTDQCGPDGIRCGGIKDPQPQPPQQPQLSSDQKRRLIVEKAFFIQDHENDSLKAFAQLTDYAASLYKPDDTDNFMADLDCVINSYCSGNPHLFWVIGLGVGKGGQNTLPGNVFRGKGSWSSRYHDFSDSQMYHFWFYTGLTYFNGKEWGTDAVTIHDSPNSPMVTSLAANGESKQDFLLGLEGVNLGWLIHTGKVKMDQIGDWLILNLSEPNGPH
jgi:hypothetical protein